MKRTGVLALAALLLAGCAGAGAQQADSTSSGQDVAAPSPSASVPGSLAASPETSESPRATATVNPDQKVIYLTFDDGPWVPYTQQILDVLHKYDAQATFFVVGEMVAQHKDLVRKIAADGHAIGNHTWDHSNLTTLSDDEIVSQLRRTTDAVESAAGDVMGACMRPPYGATDAHIRSVVKKQGYHTYLWTHWAVDWEQPPIPEFLQSLEDATEDKANILLHDGGGDRPNTVEAVRLMMPKWIKKGYTFDALPACLVPYSG